MQWLWRICVATTVVSAMVMDGVKGEEPWLWRQSSKASSIPGYVEPTTTTTTSTTTRPPRVTTFRPAFSMEQRGRSSVRTASANPYFLMMVGANRQPNDGTTKSRVVVDTAFDQEGPEPLVLGDTYTTVDRLQSARGAPPRLPRPQQHQLGGLHPDEVFYANDDLLITKGGGFHSEVFEEPSQLLHEDDVTHEEVIPTRVSPVAVLPPSPDQEYNGNIPVIVPPPTHTRTKPNSFMVGAASRNSYMTMPYAYSHVYNKVMRRRPSRYTIWHRFLPSPAMLQDVTHPSLPISLARDTDVNFLAPLPPINPDAEVFARPNQHNWRRRNL